MSIDTVQTSKINPFASMEYPMLAAAYHSDTGLNASTIKACVAALNPLQVVPAKGRAYRNESRQQSAALVIGSAAHALILEGDKVYRDQFAIMPTVDRRTKAGKSEVAAWLLDNANSTGITESQDYLVRSMAAAVRDCKPARELLRGGMAERSFFWTDRETHIDCKARLDYITGDGIVVDLKTCMNATEDGFSSSVAKYRYHVQAAFYRRAFREYYGGDPPPFRFVAVEKTAPHSVGVCELSEDSLAAADDIISIALRLWARGNDAEKNFGCYTIDLRPYQNHLSAMEENA